MPNPEQIKAIDNIMNAANELSDAYHQPREILSEVMARIILTTQELGR